MLDDVTDDFDKYVTPAAPKPRRQREFRTDRNNNPIAAAVTTGGKNQFTKALDDVGIEWEHGDPFPNDPKLSTIKIKGDPYEGARAILSNTNALKWYRSTTGKAILPKYNVKSGQDFAKLPIDHQNDIINGIYQSEGGHGTLKPSQDDFDKYVQTGPAPQASTSSDDDFDKYVVGAKAPSLESATGSASGSVSNKLLHPNTPAKSPFAPPAKMSLGTNDTQWHFGENIPNPSPRALKVLRDAVAEDARKKAAGQTIAPPPLEYQNQMRAKAGLKPLTPATNPYDVNQILSNARQSREPTFEEDRIDRIRNAGSPNLRMVEDQSMEEARRREQIKQDVIAERKRQKAEVSPKYGPMVGTPGVGNPETASTMLESAMSPVQTVRNLFKSEDGLVQEEVDRRLAAQQRATTPEMIAQRKEFGSVGAPVRAFTAPAARAGAGLVKSIAGVTSGLGIAPNRLSDYLNHRGQVLEEASSAPLDEQGREITRGLPEKVVSALGDVGFGVAEIIALKKIAPGMSLSQILAVETALKTSDMPIAARTDAVAKSALMGKVLDQHLSRVASAAVFGVPTAVETGQAYAKGNISAEDALLQTGVQAGTGFLMGGKPGEGERNARQAETTAADERSGDTVNAPSPEILPSGANEPPQRFQHLQFGEVEVLPDQSGAKAGRLKVAEVDNPEAVHYVKKSDMQGRGNARMIPIRESPAAPPLEAATASPEKLPREGAQVPSPSELRSADASRELSAPTSREDVKAAMQRHFNLPVEQADAVAAITDARAETWAKQTGKPKEEWYRSHIAGITSGGKPSESALFQKAPETPEFKRWFGDSKAVNDKGEPLVVYSGHSNPELYGDAYNPKKGTAGSFYASESPEIASNYSTGKFGAKEYYENGDQYRFPLKNGKFNKKLWQMELTPEQQAKVREFMADENLGGGSFDIEQYWKENARFDKDSARALARGGLRDLHSIWHFLESMGENIAYPKEGDAPYFQRQQKGTFENLLDHLDIPWKSHEWNQPAVLPVYLRIRNPIDADKPFPADVLAALKQAAKGERTVADSSSTHWTKDFPLKEWIQTIEGGNEYWSTQIPKKALPILKRFGYDGIKERGVKGSDAPRDQRQINWIAFDPEQVKSAIGNRGTFDPNDPNMLHQGNKASVEFLNDHRAIIRALEQPDVSSAAHEVAHVFRRDLEGSLLKSAADWAGVKNGEWKTEHEEKFARGFERYLRDGEAPTAQLKQVFAQFKDWLTNIYQTIKGTPLEGKLSPEIRQVFDEMLGRPSTPSIAESAQLPKGGMSARPETKTSGLKGEQIETPGTKNAVSADTSGERVGASSLSQTELSKHAVPESPETLRLQMTQVNYGKRPAILFTPGEDVLPHRRGLAETKTEVGTWVHDPYKLKASEIRAKVSDGSYHELLGIVEKKSGATDRVVTARAPDGTEIESAAVSPVNEAAQAKIYQERSPDATIETGTGENIVKERSFPKAAEAAGLEGGTDRDYSVLTNKEAVTRATQRVNQDGIERAISDLFKKERIDAEDTATGIVLMRRLQQAGDITKAADVASDLAKKLTEAGQAVQAASLVSRLSPEGILIAAQRQMPEGKKLSGIQATEIVIKAKFAKEAEEKVAQLEAELDRLRGRLETADSGSAPSAKRRTVERIGTLQDRLVKLEQDARARLAARSGIGKGSQTGASTIPLDIADFSIIGASKIAQKGMTFAKWSAEMVGEFGDEIKPRLREIYRASYSTYDEHRKQFAQESKERSARRAEPTAENIQSVINERIDAQTRARKARLELGRVFQGLNKTGLQKAGRGAVDVLNLPRALMTTADLSAGFRQGKMGLVRHPKIWFDSFLKQFKALSTKQYDKMVSEMELDPDFKYARRFGLELTSVGSTESVTLGAREEAFQSGFASHIPGVKHSEQAYNTMLDQLRMGWFKDYAAHLRKLGLDPERPKDVPTFQQGAELINAATGRGKLPRGLTTASPVLSTVFFSPRFWASRLKLISLPFDPRTYTQMSGPARVEAFKTLFGFTALVSSQLALAKMSGAQVDTDPDSPDFLKARWGKLHVDFSAGFQGHLRTALALIKSLEQRQRGNKDARSPADILTRYARSKESPNASFVHDFFLSDKKKGTDNQLHGTDFAGQPVYLTGETGKGTAHRIFSSPLGQRMVPMVIGDAYKAYEEMGWKEAGAAALASGLGEGVSVYAPKRPKEPAGRPSPFRINSGGFRIPAMR